MVCPQRTVFRVLLSGTQNLPRIQVRAGFCRGEIVGSEKDDEKCSLVNLRSIRTPMSTINLRRTVFYLALSGPEYIFHVFPHSYPYTYRNYAYFSFLPPP